MKPARKTVTSALALTICRRAIEFLAVLLVLAAVSEAGLRFGLGLGNPVLIAPEDICGYTLMSNEGVFRFFSHMHVHHYAMSLAVFISMPRCLSWSRRRPRGNG